MTDFGKCLQMLTGFNPVYEQAFQRSVNKACDCCGVVTETFVVSIDGEQYERLCWDGFRDTNAGARTIGEKAVA